MDIRITSTIERIEKAFFACLQKEPLWSIKNKDIVAQAEISQHTFYRYYKDKEDVLKSVEQKLLQELRQELKKPASLKDKEASYSKTTLLERFLSFCFKNKTKINLLLSNHGDIQFIYQLYTVIHQQGKVTIKSLTLHNPHQFQAMALIDCQIELVFDYLRWSDQISIQSAQSLLKRLTFREEQK